MSSYKIYKEGAFAFDFTLKIMCHLEWTQRSLSLKENFQIKYKYKLHGYFLNHLPFLLIYLPSCLIRWVGK
jgi:hypothetical protein